MSASPWSPAQETLAALRSPSQRGALLVIDVQRSFGDPEYLAAWGLDERAREAVTAAVAQTDALVREARMRGIPLVWVRLESSATAPWRGSNWLAGRAAEAPPGPDYPCVAGTPGAQWYVVEPHRDERVVTKARYSGFYGTDLEAVLRSTGVTWVALTGLTTECCVGSTAFDAIQRDIPAVVVEDATAAYDIATHEAALRQLAANAAAVVPSTQLIDLWRATATELENAS